MNIDKRIKQLDIAKSDAMEFLNMISWPEQLPEEENHYVASSSKKDTENVVVPVVGGAGCVSLVGGLATGKLVFTILGGALLIGALVAKKFQKPSQRVRVNPKVDFQKLDRKLDKIIYENVNEASEKWNSSVSAIHKSINQEILTSDISESEKTELLSIASEEFPLLLSTMDISIQLQSLEANEDLSEMKKVLGDYRAQCINNLNLIYESQLKVYKKMIY